MKLKINYNDIMCLSLACYIGMSMMGNILHYIGFLIFFAFSFSKVLNKHLKFRFDNYVKMHLLFLSLAIISFLWVDRRRLDFVTTVLICAVLFEIVYFLLWFYHYMESGGKTEKIFNIFILASFIVAIRAIYMTPASQWTHITNLFLGDIGLESHNTLGMFSAFCSGFSFWFASQYKGYKKIIYFGVCIFEIIIVILSGSRKGILAIAMVIGAFYILRSHNLKFLRNCTIALAGGIAGYFLLLNNVTLYEVAGRKLQVLIQNLFVSKDVSDWSITERTFFREQAIQLFMKHPIFGVGINGFRAYMSQIGNSHVAYSHCNYTELLANYGLIGFVLYYSVKVKNVINYIPKIHKSESLLVGIWVWSITLLILEYGFVSYYSLWAQIFWIIFFYLIYNPKYSNGQVSRE